VLEISRPQALLDPLLSAEMARAAVPFFSEAGNPKLAELKGVIAYLESQLGTDWRTGLRQLAGQGLSLAADTSGGLLIWVDGWNERVLTQLHDIVRQFAQGEAEKQGRSEQVA